MFGPPTGRQCDFVVRCKRCGENIPAPVQTMPDSWIVATCALCGEKRRYLPNEIFRGRLSAALDRLRSRQIQPPRHTAPAEPHNIQPAPVTPVRQHASIFEDD